MERLTIRENIEEVSVFGDDGIYYTRDLPHISDAINRLAAYEDTGLTPEEITAAEDRRHNCKIECLLRDYNKLCAAIGNADGIVTPEDIEHIRVLQEAEADGRLIVPLRPDGCSYCKGVFYMAGNFEGRFPANDGGTFVRQTDEITDFSFCPMCGRPLVSHEEAEAALAKEADNA